MEKQVYTAPECEVVKLDVDILTESIRLPEHVLGKNRGEDYYGEI